jgi:hypothetical protein
MLHEVKLIFGYDGYSGDIVVSPSAMIDFLRLPFADWLYQKTWENYQVDRIKEEDFHLHVYESTAHWNDEDFFFEPRCAEWLGFRVSLEQHNAECEFIFTKNLISGEIRPDFDKISIDVVDKLVGMKSTINGIISASKYKKA